MMIVCPEQRAQHYPQRLTGWTSCVRADRQKCRARDNLADAVPGTWYKANAVRRRQLILVTTVPGTLATDRIRKISLIFNVLSISSCAMIRQARLRRVVRQAHHPCPELVEGGCPLGANACRTKSSRVNRPSGKLFSMIQWLRRSFPEGFLVNHLHA